MEIKNMLKFRQYTQRKQNENVTPNLQLKQKYSVQSTIPLTERPAVSKNHHQSLIVPKNLFLADQKPNQLILGVKFGRFFGSIQQATERLVRQKMVKEKGSISVRQSEVVNETVRGISKGRQSSNIEKDLLKRVEQLQEKLKKYEESNPKLNKQNRKLEDANRQLRNQTILYQNEIFRWQKQLRLREQAQKQQQYKQKEFQTKLQKSHSHHQNMRQVKIVSIR